MKCLSRLNCTLPTASLFVSVDCYSGGVVSKTSDCTPGDAQYLEGKEWEVVASAYKASTVHPKDITPTPGFGGQRLVSSPSCIQTDCR